MHLEPRTQVEGLAHVSHLLRIGGQQLLHVNALGQDRPLQRGICLPLPRCTGTPLETHR